MYKRYIALCGYTFKYIFFLPYAVVFIAILVIHFRFFSFFISTRNSNRNSLLVLVIMNIYGRKKTKLVYKKRRNVLFNQARKY